jgi:hypothetical protein
LKRFYEGCLNYDFFDDGMNYDFFDRGIEDDRRLEGNHRRSVNHFDRSSDTPRKMAEVDRYFPQLYLGHERWLSYRTKATNIQKYSC